MKARITEYNNGAFAMLEKVGQWYIALCRDSAGELIDKVRCDDYRMALDYYAAFKRVAKNS